MNKKYLLSVIGTFCKIASFSALTPDPSPTLWERGDHFKVKLKSPVRGELSVTPNASRGFQPFRIFFKLRSSGLLNRSPRWG